MMGRDSKKHPAASVDEAFARRERASLSRGGKGGPDSNSYSIMENTFRVNARYSGLRALGKGSFGIVCSALDATQNKRVAIKKIHPLASHVVDAKHALREIRLMRYLGVHPNIVSLEDMFVCEDYDELYIVMELLDCDLHRIIQSPQPLGDAHHRYFMYQLLKGVKFLHDNRIIHRDLKPGNILVTKNCQLRIADFGLARLRPMGRGADPDDEVNHPMTEHVVTRWYRPPELMLCPDGLYGYAVDIWSVGCILAELLGRKPLFPGKTFMHQLSLIFDILGSPEPHQVAHIRNSQAKKFLHSKRDKTKVPFREVFQSASEQAVDLLEGLLVFHPPKRFSVHEGLEHPYFVPLRRADTSPCMEVPSAFEFNFEGKSLSNLQVKDFILKEVESFQIEKRHQRASPLRASANVAGKYGCRDDQKQQQWQKKSRRWIKNGSEQETHAPARSSVVGGTQPVGKTEEWERGLERAPVSAVPSAQADVFKSPRGDDVAEQDLHEASETDPMDDGDIGGSSTSTPTGENAVPSPGNPPRTRPGVCRGVTRSGRKGRRACWAIGEFQPEHHAQVQDPYYTAVGRSHRYPPCNGDAAPDLEGGSGSREESQCESNGGVFNHRPWATLRGQAPEEGPGGKDRNYTRGRWYHGAAGRYVGKDRGHTRGRWHHGGPGRYRDPHPVHETNIQGQHQRLLQQQQQQQSMQSQETQHSSKTAARVQDVEERFYMLKFERARLGHPDL